ncbi:MAG: alpha-L-fucosidase [Desulfobacterales bacterium]|nr:alpha-L-fucosidase [Desulfobacterales bacterium]
MSYEATFQSLSAYRIPDWFQNAKFGIFIHWGPFSVPAFGGKRDNLVGGNGVWYQYAMYREGSETFDHHKKTWGDQKTFGFKDFIPLFKGEKFDAGQWVDVFKKSGARYVVPVADYHDGFPMFDCSYSGDWTSVKKGPRRDVVGELAQAARKAGMHFGASSHRAYQWHFYKFDERFDTVDPENEGLYGRIHPEDAPQDRAFLDNWNARTRELVEKYELDIIWFDFGWEDPAFDRERTKFLAWYYNWAEQHGKEVVLQSKGEFPLNMAVFDVERGGLEEQSPHFWQTDTSLSKKSWCFDHDDELKTPKQVIDQLVDVVSKNGGLLLNVGPKPDGTIPQDQKDILMEIGLWLSVNGEAIYDSRPWWVYGEGDPNWVEKAREGTSYGAFSDSDTPPMTAKLIRYTQRNPFLYAIVMGRPVRTVSLRRLAKDSAYYPGEIESIEILGVPGSVSWHRDDSGLHIVFPDELPQPGHAYTVKIIPKSSS